jgi:hypothetical protein
MSISPAGKALCELFIGAFFFAMRSCEHVKVSGKRKTKLCTLNKKYFLKGRRTVNNLDPLLHLADCVTITYEQKEHDSKNGIITQYRSSDTTLCPVRIWASIVQ